MYRFLLGEQIFSIMLIFTGMVLLIYRPNSKLQVVLEILLSGLLFNQVGYLIEMTATNQEVAMIGVKVAYVGKLLAELLIFVFVMECCNRKIPAWFTHILMTLHIYIIYLVWHSDSTDLYYNSVEFVEDGLFPHLVLGYGIMYNVFTVFTFSYMIIMMITCAFELTKTNDKFTRGKLICLLIIPILSVASLLLFKVNVIKEYDVTTLVYTIDSIILVFAITRYNLTNPASLAKDALVDDFVDAVLVVNDNGEVQYANQKAQALFKIGNERKVAKISESLMSALNQGETYTMDDKVYDVNRRSIEQKGWGTSTIYVLADKTESYEYTKALEEKALKDELTNTKNRRALTQVLSSGLTESDTFVVLMNIDDFKFINEGFGFKVGDDCLLNLVGTLREVFSENEIFRFGGDEFVIVTDKDPDDLQKRLKFINDVSSSEKNEYPFTISGSYTYYRKGMDDMALHKTRRGSKGKFIFVED